MTAYLGMDGGGTKTAFLLTDGDGTTLAESRQPSCYYFDKGIQLVTDVVEAGVRAVTAAAGITPADIAFAHFGLPGYGEASQDQAVLDAIPGAVLGHDRYTCGNDMIGGWAGSLAGADGINVIAGTGSMTYARASDTASAGGARSSATRARPTGSASRASTRSRAWPTGACPADRCTSSCVAGSASSTTST
jgi:N-acetylglucosamine kinase-like BadF-type ATPase